MSNAIITEAEKIGAEAKALIEKLEAKLKSLLPSEHHHSVDEAIHTSVEETLPLSPNENDGVTTPISGSTGDTETTNTGAQ